MVKKTAACLMLFVFMVVLYGDLSRGGGISYPIEGACRLW